MSGMITGGAITGGQPALALALTAAAVLLSGPPGTRRRLSALAAPAPVHAGPAPVVRGPWLAVAGLGGAALTWLLAGPGITGSVLAMLVGAAIVVALRVLATRVTGRPDTTPTPTGALAAGWELLATCLEAGLPVPSAAEAAARRITGPVGAGLRRVAGLLELGAPAADAWSAVAHVPGLEAFGRAAMRSADTGAGLARVARAEAGRLREGLSDEAEARAERAAVLITAPLGICFLPAFLALGIAPVVIGLAGEALARW